MMHAAAIEGEAAFATQGVIDGPKQGSAKREDGDDQFGQMHGQNIEVPGGMAEEAVKATPMSVVQVAAGEDNLGNIPVPVRKNPATGHLHKGLKRWCREDGRKLL